MTCTSISAPVAHVPSTHPDAWIIEAWERRKAAFARYNALPFGDDIEGPEIDHVTRMSPEEAECWKVIDEAKGIIGTTTATSREGLMAQLWCAMSHTSTDRKQDDAATKGDIDALMALHDDLDWNIKLILAAIRGLQVKEA